MISKRSVISSMVLAFAIQISLCGVAFAGEQVSATQDGITVTKQAEWTTYNGSETDTNGNPYAKITFTVDTTKAETEVSSTILEKGDTDVVLVLDTSSSMSLGKKLSEAKEATIDFSKEILDITEYTVRVGIVGFDAEGYKIADMGSDINTIKQKVEPLTNGYGTNIQAGIWYAQKMLKDSEAKNRVIVLLSDGAATKMMSTTGSDIATGNTFEERALNQIEIAKNVVSDLKIIGVAYDTSYGDEESLKKMVTTDSNGNKLFYEAEISSSSVVNGLKSVLENVSKRITKDVVGNSLTDIIPAEFNIIEESIKMNDSNLKAELSADKKTIKWNWGNKALEKKKYIVSFVETLDKTKVPNEYFVNNVKINTNGAKIDPSVETLGSSKMCYGSKNIIQLKSPQLPLKATELQPEDILDNGVATEPGESTEKDSTDSDSIQNVLDDTPTTSDDMNLYIVGILLMSGVVAVVVGKKMKKA